VKAWVGRTQETGEDNECEDVVGRHDSSEHRGQHRCEGEEDDCGCDDPLATVHIREAAPQELGGHVAPKESCSNKALHVVDQSLEGMPHVCLLAM